MQTYVPSPVGDMAPNYKLVQLDDMHMHVRTKFWKGVPQTPGWLVALYVSRNAPEWPHLKSRAFFSRSENDRQFCCGPTH